MKKLLFSALALIPAFSLHAEVLLETGLRSPDDLKGWRK